MKQRPSVLVLAGLDPSGGAGIQADIETLNDFGCHACALITCLTVQNSENVISFETVNPQLLLQQFTALKNDIRFTAIKIGMIGSLPMLSTIVRIIDELPGIPVILDPVLAASGGTQFAQEDFIDKMKSTLLPRVTVATPNLPEARSLSGKHSIPDCAEILLQSGCEHMLITGTHEDGKNVVNRLFSQNKSEYSLTCERLKGEYHGSGCTFASALTAGIAMQQSLETAFENAHDYTHNALRMADRPGQGQLFPRRHRQIFLT